MAISARPYGQRAVLKFAQYTGCLSIAGRFTPGTFTNQITKQFREPRLLIITDPRPDAQVHSFVFVSVCLCVAVAMTVVHGCGRVVVTRGPPVAPAWPHVVDSRNDRQYICLV